MNHELQSPREPGEPHEEPTAAAHLHISREKIDVSFEVPGQQGPDLMRLMGSLGALLVLGVVCPLVTIQLALPWAWTACFLAAEVAGGVGLAVFYYRSGK